MNTNLIHNILNVALWVLGLISVVLLYAGCTQLPNGSLDCTASTVIPPTWLPIIAVATTVLASVKTGINIIRDGFKGLTKEQPPVK